MKPFPRTSPRPSTATMVFIGVSPLSLGLDEDFRKRGVRNCRLAVLPKGCQGLWFSITRLPNYPFTKSPSVFIRNSQDMSCQRRQFRIHGRQVSGPVDLLAIRQAHLRIHRFPSRAILLADCHVKAHLVRIVLGLAPLMQ